MASLVLAFACRQCPQSVFRRPALVVGRQFTTSQSLLSAKSRKKKKSPIRVPSKKALAAKQRKRDNAERQLINSNPDKMTLADAVNVLRAVEVASHNSSYELVVTTQMRRGSNIPRGRLNLPIEVEKRKKDVVLVFAEGKEAEEARKAGAAFVGGVELADEVAQGQHQAATVYLCSPSLIRAITPKLGRILGPRGLMPSERRGTVTEDAAKYIEDLRSTSEWKGDKFGTVRTAVAKLHFTRDDVITNVRHFIDLVKRSTVDISQKQVQTKKGAKPKPSSHSVMRVMLSSTRGPGIQIADY